MSCAHDEGALSLAPTPCCATTAVKKLDADDHVIWPNLEWRIFQLSVLIQIRDICYIQEISIFEK